MSAYFNLIYKILIILRDNMELERFDVNQLSHDSLNISYPLWCRIMAMLNDEGYIKGIQVWNSFDTQHPKVALTRIEITLRGLEYLEENSLMRKAANLAKGIKESTPFF